MTLSSFYKSENQKNLQIKHLNQLFLGTEDHKAKKNVEIMRDSENREMLMFIQNKNFYFLNLDKLAKKWKIRLKSIFNGLQEEDLQKDYEFALSTLACEKERIFLLSSAKYFKIGIFALSYNDGSLEFFGESDKSVFYRYYVLFIFII